MSVPSRQPAGVPTGGQFAPEQKAETDLALDATGQPDPAFSMIEREWHAVHLLGRVIDTVYVYERQSAYCRGLAYAAGAGVASFLNPHDASKRVRINASIQGAVERGVHIGEVDRSRLLGDIADLVDDRPVTREVADRQLRDMLGAVIATHTESNPELPGSEKSPYQSGQLGMRYGFADVAARWAIPGSYRARTAKAVIDALNDDIYDIDRLRKVATSQLGRDARWRTPYEYVDDWTEED